MARKPTKISDVEQITTAYEDALKSFSFFKQAQPRVVDVPEDILQRLLKLPDTTTFAGLRDYALILFTLDTGIRPKEATSLKVKNFDLKHNLATVPADESKTRTTRILPILPPTAQAIHKLVNVQHPSWDNNIPVFCSCEGTQLNKSSWKSRLDKYSKSIKQINYKEKQKRVKLIGS
jgi:integrase